MPCPNLDPLEKSTNLRVHRIHVQTVFFHQVAVAPAPFGEPILNADSTHPGRCRSRGDLSDCRPQSTKDRMFLQYNDHVMPPAYRCDLSFVDGLDARRAPHRTTVQCFRHENGGM